MRITGAILILALTWANGGLATAVDYTTDVKPILRRHCYRCHGALKQESELRLDHVSFIRAGGVRGATIASASNESPLVQAVNGTGDVERMPLEADPLSDEEIATLAAWVEAGAPAPDEPLPEDPREHWSFQKPVRPPLPTVENADWSDHPIDRFLAAGHEAQGLTPSEPAARHVLLRRVYLDLVGLPPAPDELRAFSNDESSDAYERVVDRLLASPHYGERWGRHWMDVWRYSDWDGYQAEVRESQPHIWRWRDWIIESLNADKPYDRMIEEMLAADELATGDPAALRATGFLVRNWYKFNRNVWLDATVEHTSKAFLGITLNCARCHDHMYDPIAQREYYQFRAFFEPHNVRTDRVAGQSDTKQDGLVRVFDEKADTPTYLFERGNEAAPEKDNPLSPAVPQVLGGNALSIEPVVLSPVEHYPGLRSFVQQEELAQAKANLAKQEAAMVAASDALAAARKRLDEFVAARVGPSKPAKAATTATDAVDGAGAPDEARQASDSESEEPSDEANESGLTGEIEKASTAAALAEGELLVASADLAATRARIAADNAAFAAPPAENAGELAREANRLERLANVHRTRRNVVQIESKLAASAGSDDESVKKSREADKKKLTAAKEKYESAQAALGKPGEQYTHFGKVYPPTTTGRRAALARWIASENNPLTARVAVNHIWMRHFGSPLVESVFEFGRNGRRPTHPELLDWLAVELMENGWRTKPIHRLIVTSGAYRMRSRSADEANKARDPENKLLWRMNPRRMEAEVVRDSTLVVAGMLDPTMFGPVLDQNTGMKVPRRSIYFRSSKEKKMTFLDVFDRANVTDCYRRSETVVPQQALAMINSPLSLAAARRLAGALTTDLSEGDASTANEPFVAAAFERVLCRQATPQERDMCLEFLAAQSRRFAEPEALVAFGSGPENEVKPSTDPRQRARENLVHVLLNHNDFLTVR